MKIICNQDNSMNEKRHWDLGTIWIKENKTSVYDKFMTNLYSSQNRPILPDNITGLYRPILPTNITGLSLNRLKKLKERLDKTQHLLNHSHKKQIVWKHGLETRLWKHVLIEIFMLC